jgi:hypothetical protein
MSDSIKKWFEMNEDRWTADSTYSHNDIKKDPIVEDVINTMRARSRDGILKYGTTLHDSPDGFYKFLNHLQEELMDATLYIEKLKQQK